jgi:hypothetical protein
MIRATAKMPLALRDQWGQTPLIGRERVHRADAVCDQRCLTPLIFSGANEAGFAPRKCGETVQNPEALRRASR